MVRPQVSTSTALGVAPVAIFGIDGDLGVFVSLLVIFLIAIWFALIFWTYADARRRLEDGVLIGSATLAAAIFPFAGALVYAIVRPPETLDDAYERDLDVRAAELRVRLLESAVKGGPGSSAHASTLAGELSGEPGARRGGSQEQRSQESGSRESGSQESGSQRAGSQRPAQQSARSSAGPSGPAKTSRPASGPAPTRPGQSQRPAAGKPASRPPIAGSDGA